MSVNRRFVLKSMALTGVAGMALSNALSGLAGPVSAASQPSNAPAHLLALSVGGTAEALFLQGANAAFGQIVPVQRPAQDLQAMLTLEQQLRRSESLRVIGLLDDASATLALDMARSAGAKVLWVGQHTRTGALTHHRLQSTDLSHLCNQRFNQQLTACGASNYRAYAAKDSLSERYTSTPVHRSGGSSEWVSSLGYLLASVGQEPAMAAPIASGNVSLSGSFVSFLIET